MNPVPLSCRRQMPVFLNFFYYKRMYIHHSESYLSSNYINISKKYLGINYCTWTHHVLCRPMPSLNLRGISSNTTKRMCWNCTNELDNMTIFCDACNCLQPVDISYDLFEIIGIEQSFKVNLPDLKHKYRSLQSVLHPDKFSSKSKKEQEFSEEYSSHVNKAYTTLLDPLERGVYLLKMQNIVVEESTSEMDKLFLMHIMELNEELENESSPQKLSDLNQRIKKEIDSLVSQVEEAFENNNALLAKELLMKMKYYYSIEKKIKEIKQKLNIPD